MSLRKLALKGVFWSTLQMFASQGISFVVSVILARLLLPSEFGLVGMLGIFMGIGGVLINGGLTQSLIRTADPDDEDFSTVFYFNLIGSIVVYVVLFVSAPLIGQFYQQTVLTSIVRLYGVTFIINAFATIQNTRLNKMLDFKTQMLVSIPSLIVSSLVGVFMAYYGYGVWSLVWMAVIQSLVGTIQLWYWSRWKPLWIFNREKFNFHFHYGFKLMFSGILDILFTNVYTIIIGKFFSPMQVGYFNRANSLQMLPVGNASSIISKVSYPLFASIQEDDIRLKIVYKKIMQMVIFVVSPTLVLMTVLSEPLFRWLFTEKWLPAVPYFQILFVNGILYPIHVYNLQILNVKGRSDLFLKLEIIKKIIVVIAVLISFRYGIFGLLYGTVITSLIAFFINTHYSGKFIDYSAWKQTKDLMPIVLLSFMVGAIIYLIDYEMMVLNLGDLFRLIFGGGFGVILFLGLSYLFKMSSLMELIKIIKRQ